MERLNSDMINEIFRYLDPSYIIFSTFYVSKRIMEMSIRFLNFMNVSKLKKKSLFKTLCRDIRDEVSIERYTNFGLEYELSNSNICLYAIKYDNLELLRYMLEITESVYDLNIQINDSRYNSLQYFYENLCEDIYKLRSKICFYSAKYGSFECLKYTCKILENNELYSNIQPKFSYNVSNNRNIEYFQDIFLSTNSWNEDICSNAARSGSLECLKYAHENGYPWDKR